MLAFAASLIMAKYLLRNKARELRRKGISVKKIAEYLKVSKSSASIWTRDIILTVKQLEKLRNAMLRGSELGRIKGALIQKERRLKFIEDSRNKGIKELPSINERELLIAGLALYWGEGSRKSQEVEFCNSDPKMIQFLLLWLKKCFGITPSEIKCCVGINQMHRKREQVVRGYWSKISGIPISQFRKTSLKKVKNNKVYENFNEHYGTLSVIVTKPSRFYFKILGLIEGLYQAGSKYNRDFNLMPG
jgi:transcriptional regulator with XRE-family HTH domain